MGCEKKTRNISVDFFFVYIFLIFAQNRDCGYTLGPPRRGGSNEYLQPMFWIKNEENGYTPVNPSFTIKNGVQGGKSLRGMFLNILNGGCMPS